MNNILHIITFTLRQKLLIKSHFDSRILTKSECEIKVTNIADTAIIHNIKILKTDFIDEIKISEIPSYLTTSTHDKKSISPDIEEGEEQKDV